MNGTADLETVFLVSGLIAAWSGTIVACMHALGILPPRYKRQLAEIQETTARTIAGSIKTAMEELAQSSEAQGQAQAQVFATQLAQGVAHATQAGLEPLAARLETAIGQGGERTERALRDGLGALADTVTAIQASSAGQALGAASGVVRNEKALAKTGARRLLANYANTAGPIVGAVASGAMALGLVDDDSIVKAAEFLLENPELAQKLQNAYNTVREKKGGISGSTGYQPGISR